MFMSPQVLQIMMNAQKNMKVAAWRSWNGWSEADGGLAKLRICARLEAEYAECKAKEEEAEALVEQKLKALSDVAMRSLDTRKRNFLVSIFAKGGPEAKNAYFIRRVRGVPRCCGAFTPSTRLVSVREDDRWSLVQI
jgi:hypothetical protein